MANRPGRAHRGGLLASAVTLLVAQSGFVSAAEISLRGDEQGLAVTIEDAPLRDVLQSLASRGLVDVVTAPDLDETISLEADAMSLSELLRRLLRRQSYVLFSNPDVDRLWVLPTAGQSRATHWRALSGVSRLRLELTDPDPGVREEAVLALSDLEPALAIDMAMSAINDTDRDVRETAAAVLEDLDATDLVRP